MALDGKVLRRARQRLENNKRMREAELSRRTMEVYAVSPAVKDIDRRIRQTAAEAINYLLNNRQPRCRLHRAESRQ